MLFDLFNEFLDKNEDADLNEFEVRKSQISKINLLKGEWAIKILAGMISANTHSNEQMQEQVNASIKYADMLYETIKRQEEEQFTKARKRIK